MSASVCISMRSVKIVFTWPVIRIPQINQGRLDEDLSENWHTWNFVLLTRTCERNSKKDGQGFRGLHQSPRSGKVSRSQPLQGQHLQGIKRTAERGAVKCGGQHKPVITLYATKRHLSYGFKQKGNLIRIDNPRGVILESTIPRLFAKSMQYNFLVTLFYYAQFLLFKTFVCTNSLINLKSMRISLV